MNQATVKIELMDAAPEDFKLFLGWFSAGNDNKVRKYTRKDGQLYWLKSKRTDNYEGPYEIGSHTDLKELKHWMDLGLVFIMRRPPESNIKTITEEVAAAS